jgi:hypothetical protein
VKRLLACSILSALAAASAAAGDAQTPAFDPHYLSEQVRTLSSDAFEGRGPATAGEKRTVAYVISQMKAAGLQPAGALKDGKRSWTQPVPLGRFEITGTPSFSLTMDGKSEPLTQGDQIAVRAAQDGSTSVDIANAPLVFVGYGVKAPERHWDDFKGVDLHGKIAVALINDPDFETGQGDFGGKAMTYYGRWTYKYEEIARQGALGLLIIHETAPASYGWATVKNSNTNTQFDIVREHPAEVHAKVEGWIQRDLAVQMFQHAGLDFDALKKQAQTRDFKPVTLKGESFSAKFNVDASVITSQNILGRVKGKRALGSPGRGRARCQRRPHLQRRGGQRHRHRGPARAGQGLRARAEAGALGGIPQCDRRGERPARFGVLRHPSALPRGQDGGGDQHGCHGPARPGAQLHHLRQRQARPAR